MKLYFPLYIIVYLLIVTEINAQLNPILTAMPFPKTSIPYRAPGIDDGVKTIAAVPINVKQPGAIEVKPTFGVAPSALQCALLMDIHPSLKLEGERNNASLVDLKWVAKDLYNKKGFEVQRSVGDTNNFKFITFVNAYAKALVKEEYKLTDINRTIQPAWYRLKQVNPEGYVYSNIVLVKGMQQFNLFPNPATDVLFLKLQSIENSNISIMVYDMRGALVLNKQTWVEKDIINTKHINVQTLHSGVYNVKVANTDSTLYSEKFIKR